MLNKFKEKLEQQVDKLKEKVPGLKPVIELGDKITAKLLDKFGDTPEKLVKRKRFFRRIRNFFSIRNVAMIIGIIVSIPGIAFLVYTSINYYHSNKNELSSTEYITISNLNYATKYLVHRLKTERTTRKDIRKIIKELNGIKKFGDAAKPGPCADGNLAFSESAKPGTVILNFDPYEYAFIFEGYNCDARLIVSNTIKLKRPPRDNKQEEKIKDSHHKNIKKDKNHKDANHNAGHQNSASQHSEIPAHNTSSSHKEPDGHHSPTPHSEHNITEHPTMTGHVTAPGAEKHSTGHHSSPDHSVKQSSDHPTPDHKPASEKTTLPKTENVTPKNIPVIEHTTPPESKDTSSNHKPASASSNTDHTENSASEHKPAPASTNTPHQEENSTHH